MSIGMEQRRNQPSVLPGLNKPDLHCAVLWEDELPLAQSLVQQCHQTISEIKKIEKNKTDSTSIALSERNQQPDLMASGSL
jgi:hypothetical protein